MLVGVMKVKWAWMVLFLVPTGGAGYLAWISWQANDDGKWLFLVFTGFFLALLVAPFLPEGREKKKQVPVPGTRFAGAWVLPFYFLLFGGLLTLAWLVRLFHHKGISRGLSFADGCAGPIVPRDFSGVSLLPH